jgi:hypothetical protein
MKVYSILILAALACTSIEPYTEISSTGSEIPASEAISGELVSLAEYQAAVEAQIEQYGFIRELPDGLRPEDTPETKEYLQNIEQMIQDYKNPGLYYLLQWEVVGLPIKNGTFPPPLTSYIGDGNYIKEYSETINKNIGLKIIQEIRQSYQERMTENKIWDIHEIMALEYLTRLDPFYLDSIQTSDQASGVAPRPSEMIYVLLSDNAEAKLGNLTIHRYYQYEGWKRELKDRERRFGTYLSQYYPNRPSFADLQKTLAVLFEDFLTLRLSDPKYEDLSKGLRPELLNYTIQFLDEAEAPWIGLTAQEFFLESPFQLQDDSWRWAESLSESEGILEWQIIKAMEVKGRFIETPYIVEFLIEDPFLYPIKFNTNFVSEDSNTKEERFYLFHSLNNRLLNYKIFP